MNDTLQDNYIIDVIRDRVSNVPLLPHVVTRLLSIIGKSDHSLNDVVKIVENDAALASRVLRVANSAAFSPRQGITGLSQAMLHLGEKMVAGIAIGSCTSSVFNKELPGYESGAGGLWDHCLRTAIATREVTALLSKKISTDLAFTAGLLHDIGKSIIDEFLKGHANEMMIFCENSAGNDFLDAERDSIGIDHAEVGYALATHWNLPLPLCSAIRYHHRPSEAEEGRQELVYLVHVGDILAMLGGVGTGADSLTYKVDEGYRTYFNLTRDDLPKVLLYIEDEFQRSKSAIFCE